ncbi:hypothetical protein EXU57_13185 [Segetibacter sp. 3557_3]|uniref:hypothetical protein n=1 Tax=Segetibacter sp. 3557_3 TaxID=2547429 RepID=UPI00105860DE|nr:hypothetical protein [Segetibacter sp. 3557_3]TDH25650.1 hypothetical protein EXU57_13185 [Segetibacter sp. 3557_3]
MPVKKKRSPVPYAFASVLCLVPPMLIQFLWMNSTGESLGISSRIGEFLSFFPIFLQRFTTINFISIAFCAGGILLACIAFRNRAASSTALAMLLVTTGLILMILSVFRLL